MSILPTHADPTPGTHNWQHTTLSVYCTQCTTMQANVSHHPHSRTITSRSTRPPHKHHPKPFTSSAAQTRLRRPLHTARRAADPEQPSGDTTPSTSSSTGAKNHYRSWALMADAQALSSTVCTSKRHHSSSTASILTPPRVYRIHKPSPALSCL